MDTPPVPKRAKTCVDAESSANQGAGDIPVTEEDQTSGDTKVLSALERLPSELLWSIIAYVPEAVHSMRLVSFLSNSFFSVRYE